MDKFGSEYSCFNKLFQGVKTRDKNYELDVTGKRKLNITKDKRFI